MLGQILLYKKNVVTLQSKVEYGYSAQFNTNLP